MYFQAYVTKLTGFVCPAAFILYVYSAAKVYLSWHFHIHRMAVVNLQLLYKVIFSMVFSNITLKFLALYNFDEVKFTEIFPDEIILLFFFF